MDERSSFLEDKGGVYKRAVILALRQRSNDQALIYVEKAKSRVLGDYLRNNIDIRLRAGDKAGEAILEDLARLREEQAWYSSIVYETENEISPNDIPTTHIRSMKPGQARQEMQKRERKIEHLLEQMQLRLVGDLVSRSHSHWIDSSVISLLQQLEDSTLVLEYYMTEQDLYIFQLTHTGIDVKIVQNAVPELKRLLSRWRANIMLAAQASSLEDCTQTFIGLQANSFGLLQRVYDLLLRPVMSVLNTYENLVVVPYGMLHYLPFHCLFDGVQFVVERLNVSYLPTVTLHDICSRRGQHIKAKDIQLQDSLIMGLTDNGRLPFVRREAEAVAKQLRTSYSLDEAATTSLLQQWAHKSPIVHIAAHGHFRLDAPNFSYIKLADRQLSTSEVFNLDLSLCSLVTVSACETGRVVVGGIDEVIGLGRGFLYAVAASLLLTLWKVDDASSAELMEMFYQALLNNSSKVAALADAQRTFLANARASIHPYSVHPYFWAAFHLIGDPSGLLPNEM